MMPNKHAHATQPATGFDDIEEHSRTELGEPVSDAGIRCSSPRSGKANDVHFANPKHVKKWTGRSAIIRENGGTEPAGATESPPTSHAATRPEVALPWAQRKFVQHMGAESGEVTNLLKSRTHGQHQLTERRPHDGSLQMDPWSPGMKTEIKVIAKKKVARILQEKLTEEHSKWASKLRQLDDASALQPTKARPMRVRHLIDFFETLQEAATAGVNCKGIVAQPAL